MDELSVISHAKVNLTLDIVRKLDSGYHEIKSVMQQVSLCDTIKLRGSDSIKIICNEQIPLKQNTVFKAIKLLKDRFNTEKNVEVSIEKRIPIAAGLSGGSSNAAAALKGLSQLWDLNLSEAQLLGIAKEIGMDVSFSVVGGTCLSTGRGEIIEKLAPLHGIDILLVNPGFEVSTKWAYGMLDPSRFNKAKSTEKMLEAMKKGAKEIAKHLHNDFEETISGNYPVIEDIKQRLISSGALNASLTGSGPTVFGIFESEDALSKAYDSLKNDFELVFKAKTIKSQ